MGAVDIGIGSVAAPDVLLSRNADGILQLKSDGTSAAEFRVYGDDTTAAKYIAIKHDGTNPIIDTDGSDLLIKDGGTQIATKATSGINLGGYKLFGFTRNVRVMPDDTSAVVAQSDYNVTSAFTADRTKPLPSAAANATMAIIDNDSASRLTIFIV